ncbi:MAG: ATP-binding protein [Myxococcota bacterium]
MSEPARGSLRRRLTVFFLLAGGPAVLIGAGAVTIIDRIIADEIQLRGRETYSATGRALATQRARVEEQIARLVDQEAIRGLARSVGDDLEVERSEPLASSLASAAGLDLLTIGALAGPSRGTILSSAHLRDSVGDRIPLTLGGAKKRSGFAEELVAGNPPESVPSILAATIIEQQGAPQLLVYGGVRLDADFLDAIARVGGGALVLESGNGRRQRFPRGADQGSELREAGLIELPAIDASGRTLPAKLRVEVDVTRLEHGRRRILALAFGWVVFALAAALVLGSWLSRRITEPIIRLSRAAEQIGGGDLEVRVEHGGNDEIGRLIGSFNEMVEEIKENRERVARAERVAAWREAARRIAHEIKNPLFPMQMAMETLRKAFKNQHPELPSIAEESTKVVLEEIRSISRMVSEFSEFARLPRPKIEPTEPRAILEHARALYGNLPSNVTLSLDTREVDGAQVAADQEQIARVIINLVKNAIEALGDKPGRIELTAKAARRATRDGVSLEVRDNGPGMSEEVKGQLFAPYFTTKPEGTGLGLSIVERIVAEHDGAIDVESTVNEGSTFRIWLPSQAAPSLA